MIRPRLVRYRRVLTFITALTAISLLPSAARAATINTYSFSQGGWINLFVGTPPFDQLQGSFTGTVDSLDHIELADLSAFSMTFTYPDPNQPGVTDTLTSSLADLQLFSFNVGSFNSTPATGGSSLSIITAHDYGSGTTTPVTMCVGLPAAFFPVCSGPFGLPFPPGTTGSVAGSFFYTTSIATVTLVSSVEVPDPVTTIPEPTTLMLFGTGLSGLLITRRRRASI